MEEAPRHALFLLDAAGRAVDLCCRPAPVRVEFLRCISPSSPQSCVPFVGEERDCDRCPGGCACGRTAGESTQRDVASDLNASANDSYLLLFTERFA